MNICAGVRSPSAGVLEALQQQVKIFTVNPIPLFNVHFCKMSVLVICKVRFMKGQIVALLDICLFLSVIYGSPQCSKLSSVWSPTL